MKIHYEHYPAGRNDAGQPHQDCKAVCTRCGLVKVFRHHRQFAANRRDAERGMEGHFCDRDRRGAG